MRVGLFRIALLGISFVLTLGLGECFVRVVTPQPVSWLAIYQPHPELPFFSMLPDQKLHVVTGETDWTVQTDSRGLRVGESPEPKAQCTALWLGDSFTFGHGVDYEDSFVGRIEANTVGVGHVNAAVAGYGPNEYRATLESLGSSGLEFEWVFVVSYVGNDFHDTLWEKKADVVDGIIGNKAGLKSFAKRKSHLYRLLSAVYHSLAGGDQDSYRAVSEQLARPSAWQEEFLATAHERYDVAMRGIQEYAVRNGKKLAFVILPTREAAAQYRLAESRSETDAAGNPDEARPMLPVERARSIFEGIGAHYSDLTAVVAATPVEDTFFRFDGHLTPEANRRVAAALMSEYAFQCGAPASASAPAGRDS